MTNPGPYYQPPGFRAPEPRREVRWLPIVIAGIFVGIAVLFLAVIAYPGLFGLSSPTSPGRFGLFGGFFGFFFILLIAFFIVRVLFWSTRAQRYGRRNRVGPGGPYGAHRPAAVARMRYARGEITRDQYNQIMQDLDRPSGPP